MTNREASKVYAANHRQSFFLSTVDMSKLSLAFTWEAACKRERDGAYSMDHQNRHKLQSHKSTFTEGASS